MDRLTSEMFGGGGRQMRIAVTAIAIAVAVAACGSSNGAGAAGGSQSASFLDFASCMRSNGVSNYPDSSGDSLPPGVNPSSPAFKAAFGVCSKRLPVQHQEAFSSQGLEQLLGFARCMRSHGLTGFPDPTTTKPAGHTGYNALIHRGGAYLGVPDTINPASPVYKQAAAGCRSVLVPG